MCRFGMRVRGLIGETGPALKPTGWLTNGWYIGQEAARKCQHYDPERGRHRGHIPIIGGRVARRCEVYPGALCKAIIEGLEAQLEARGVIEKVGAVCVN